jgi:hypothetical protein
VVELSLGGAQLHAPDVALPNRFVLQIANMSAELACDVVWRKDFAVGVRFTRLRGPLRVS